MRLFVGIPLADAVVGELGALASRLRKSGQASAGGLRWTAPESWHITLQFLGNATAGQLECLKARLCEVRAAPGPVEMGELGAFDRADVFFAGVVVTLGLARLQHEVVAATSRCGFVAEAREFHPHITLARIAGSQRAREQGSKNAGKGSNGMRDLITKAGSGRFTHFAAREFLLYESHLSAEGSKYEVRARFTLSS